MSPVYLKKKTKTNTEAINGIYKEKTSCPNGVIVGKIPTQLKPNSY